jgi:universal stress protein E
MPMTPRLSGTGIADPASGRRAKGATAARPKTYLVALDPKAGSSPAVDRAAWFALRTQARISLFLAESILALDREPGLRDKLLERDRRRLQREADRLEHHGLQADVDVRWGPETDSVMRKAADSSAAIVFKDTHYHSVLRRALFSNIEWSLIRHCPAALWLVKNKPFADSPRVLAAIDPSGEHGKSPALDEEILATAKLVSRVTAGELYVIHVIGPVHARVSALAAAGVPPAAGAVLADRFPDDVGRDEVLTALDRLVARAGIDSRHLKVERGTPSKLLVEVASDLGADLVVMGAVSRDPIRNALIGNTAERVLDRLPCDLLVVKEPTTAS